MGTSRINSVDETTLLDARVHPPIDFITDALMFKIARLAALNERSGGHYFKAEHGITLNQWLVLGLTCVLQPVPSSQVRKILYMDKGQFSRVVNQLVELKHIRTSTDCDDARVIALQLTKRGRTFHDKLLKSSMQRNEAAVSALSKTECKEFIRLLDKINTHTEEVQKNAGEIR